LIAESAVFLTQLELALPTVEFGLELAHALGVTTILNPAPGCLLAESIYPNCDYLTPNESEAEVLTGIGWVRSRMRSGRRMRCWGAGWGRSW
jgi:ribokinase